MTAPFGAFSGSCPILDTGGGAASSPWPARPSAKYPDYLLHADFLNTFIQFPPSQTPASFTIDQVEKDVEAKIRAMAKKPVGD